MGRKAGHETTRKAGHETTRQKRKREEVEEAERERVLRDEERARGAKDRASRAARRQAAREQEQATATTVERTETAVERVEPGRGPFQAYIHRAYATCRSDTEKIDMQSKLQERMRNCGNIWDVDWDAEPLPTLIIRPEWERHTKGIGSRLLAKMGFLGGETKAMEPVQVTMRARTAGLGFRADELATRGAVWSFDKQQEVFPDAVTPVSYDDDDDDVSGHSYDYITGERIPPAPQLFYNTIIPDGVRPGDQFRVLVNHQELMVTCPPDGRPGMKMNFSVPRSNEQQQTSSWKPAPNLPMAPFCYWAGGRVRARPPLCRNLPCTRPDCYFDHPGEQPRGPTPRCFISGCSRPDCYFSH